MKACLALVFLLFADSAIAQFCSGSLSDPIINRTFGSESAALPPTSSQFQYTDDCPKAGQYTIKNLSFGCGNRSWLMLAGDHTKGVNGQYMLVNAENNNQIVYVDTARGLCPNTTYQFTAWITSVMQNFSCGGNYVLPNLMFTIETLDGIILFGSATGEIPLTEDKEWKQYGLSFALTNAADAIVVKIKTQSSPGCGAGFAIDDILLSMCGPAGYATIDNETGPKNVCADYTDPFLLHASISDGFTNPDMQWQKSTDTGKTWINIDGATTASYAVPKRMSDVVLYRFVAAEKGNINSANCRIASNVIYTEIHPVPPHRAPQSFLGCLNKPLPLPQTDPKALQIQWLGPNYFSSTDPSSIIPAIQYKDSGLYTLKQSFYFGCTSTDSFYLRIYPGTTISTPTSYSVCEGEPLQLNATGNGIFEWQPAKGLSNNHSGHPVATLFDSTVYKVMLTNSFGCKDSALVNVNVYKKPVVNAGPDLKIEKGDTLTIQASVQGTETKIAWSPGLYINNPAVINPKVYPAEDILYTVTATSMVGCGEANDNFAITVFGDVFVPTAFTPNADGKNDEFSIFAADSYQLVKLLIYDRWGKQVFTSNNIHFSWDGTFKNQPLPDGTYIYYLQLKKSTGKMVTKQGTVVLIR